MEQPPYGRLEALEPIQRLAATADRVKLGDHALYERMSRPKFPVTTADIIHCLRNGWTVDDLRLETRKDWVYRVCGHTEDGKPIKVCVIFRSTDLIEVVTIIRV